MTNIKQTEQKESCGQKNNVVRHSQLSFVKIPRHNIKSIMQLKCKIKHSALFNEEERTQKTPRSNQKNENGLN